MTRRKAGASRRDLTEKIENSRAAMEGKEADLDLHASDLEQERRTLESLELAGAEEDSRLVEDLIERAENISAEQFDRENHELERLQEGNEDLEQEFQQGADLAESDLGKISGAKVEGSAASEAMLRAEEAASACREFLREHAAETRRAREASERAQEVLGSKLQAILGKR